MGHKKIVIYYLSPRGSDPLVPKRTKAWVSKRFMVGAHVHIDQSAERSFNLSCAKLTKTGSGITLSDQYIGLGA